MGTKPVFFSFHYALDAMRVQQVRNIGALEDNKPVSANEWEEVKKKGDAGIAAWIEESLKYKRAVVVLIGKETAQRKWVRHEIIKGWEAGKGVVGVHIHNLKDPSSGVCAKGPNPFAGVKVGNIDLGDVVRVHDPVATDAYNNIRANLAAWVDSAIFARG